MSVTDQIPSKVGQRVQDVFTDSRGRVTELGWRLTTKVAVVEWDHPETGLGEDDSVFPVDALRVVNEIRLDVDAYDDPSSWFFVDSVSNGTEHGPVYQLKDGTIVKGIDRMRAFMLGFSQPDRQG